MSIVVKAYQRIINFIIEWCYFFWVICEAVIRIAGGIVVTYIIYGFLTFGQSGNSGHSTVAMIGAMIAMLFWKPDKGFMFDALADQARLEDPLTTKAEKVKIIRRSQNRLLKHDWTIRIKIIVIVGLFIALVMNIVK